MRYVCMDRTEPWLQRTIVDVDMFPVVVNGVPVLSDYTLQGVRFIRRISNQLEGLFLKPWMCGGIFCSERFLMENTSIIFHTLCGEEYLNVCIESTYICIYIYMYMAWNIQWSPIPLLWYTPSIFRTQQGRATGESGKNVWRMNVPCLLRRVAITERVIFPEQKHCHWNVPCGTHTCI